MTPRTLLVGIIALSLAAATAFFGQGWLTKQRNELYASLPKSVAKSDAPKVLVARKALPAGMILTAGHLEWKEWPEDGVSTSFIVQGQGELTDKAIHGAVLRRVISAGEPVTEDRVVKAGERGFLAAVLTRLSFPPKTGPLFLETEGGCDGSETSFRRGRTEAPARD